VRRESGKDFVVRYGLFGRGIAETAEKLLRSCAGHEQLASWALQERPISRLYNFATW